ncbi:UDP-N-acetylglucosamine 1-carboxyvinyltransferase [Candidatus Dependentiae bacterium]|nr:UDP-N-acetylglucosamine 1-carboxyvinyltransferase [Candidatus Dependentiae bacterium]
MDKFIIEECKKISGEIFVSGSKNAALPIMAATLLASGEYVLSNIPDLRDVKTMSKVLEHLGAKTKYDNISKKLIINTEGIKKSSAAPYELVKTMRASAVVLGPLLSRFGEAKVSLPGGCAIGARPINIHLRGFEELGAAINIEDGYVLAKTTKKLKAAVISLDFPSVGATENLMMAACLAEGKTRILNAAREPEIVDLANFLNKMGAKIKNAGESNIDVTGVKKLKPVSYKIIPDRIEFGTFITAGAMIPGEITIKNVNTEHLPGVIEKIRKTGVIIENSGANAVIVSRMKEKLKPVNIKTMPYPGFPTDMQAQMCAALCLADGVSCISETVFENRFMHISELNRLGANIRIDRNTAVITGVKKLTGAQIMATDLRASAALVLAGLASSGKTELLRVYHIDRGYEHIEKKFAHIGAKIHRIKAEVI